MRRDIQDSVSVRKKINEKSKISTSDRNLAMLHFFFFEINNTFKKFEIPQLNRVIVAALIPIVPCKNEVFRFLTGDFSV